MADRPGSYRETRVSRRTMVIRKAREEDAKRLEERPDALTAPAAARRDTEVVPARPTPAPPRRHVPAEESDPRASRRRVTGSTVVVEKGGASSRRLVVSGPSADRPASIRVTGGDTIVRYKSGGLVVRRGDRRARWRKRAILAYAICYVAVFAVYAYYLFTGTTAVQPAEYLDHAFGKRRGEGILQLEWAAMQAMRGNRTPAEVRLAQALVFHDEANDTIRVEAGDRLTLLTAAKLGQAIIRDQQREEGRRTFDKPFRLYRETFLTNMNWPFWLAAMNAFGFFLLMGLFLWRPGRTYLGTQGKKTAVALREAREALDRSQELRDGYGRLSAEIAARGATLRQEIAAREDDARETLIAQARERVAGIEDETREVLDKEKAAVTAAMGREAAGEACRRAAAILGERIGRGEHDLAVDELIADIAMHRFF